MNYRQILTEYWQQYFPKYQIPKGFHVHHIKPQCTFENKEDPLWKNTIGKELSNKISKIQHDPAWKQKHSKTCEYCNKTVSAGNFARWHGNKCKLNTKNH